MISDVVNGMRVTSMLFGPDDPPIPEAQWVQQILESAADAFIRVGKCAPVFTLLTDYPLRGLVHLSPDPRWENEKDRLESGVRAMAEHLHARLAVYICEMWIAFVDPGTDRSTYKGPRPSEHPERREAIVLQADSPHIKPNQQQWLALIERDADGKPTLKPWMPWAWGEGRFINLLPDYPRTDIAGQA